MVSSSNSSMNKSARTEDRGDPMAAPEVCSWNWSLHLKHDDETHVRSSSWTCSGVRLVRYVMAGSAWTGRLTRMSDWLSLRSLMMSTNWLELELFDGWDGVSWQTSVCVSRQDGSHLVVIICGGHDHSGITLVGWHDVDGLVQMESLDGGIFLFTCIGSLAFLRVCRTWMRTWLAAALSRCLSAGSVDWIMSLTGILRGVRAKFMSLESTLVSIGVRLRWLRFTTVCCVKALALQRWGLVAKDRVTRWSILLTTLLFVDLALLLDQSWKNLETCFLRVTWKW